MVWQAGQDLVTILYTPGRVILLYHPAGLHYCVHPSHLGFGYQAGILGPPHSPAHAALLRRGVGTQGAVQIGVQVDFLAAKGQQNFRDQGLGGQIVGAGIFG